MPPDAAVKALYDELLYAWNRQDARTFALLFSPSSTVVGVDGSQVDGTDVEELVAPAFADPPTAECVGTVRGVEELADGVVLLRAIVGMVPPGGQEPDPATSALQSLVAVRAEDGWEIALLQNTPALQPASA
jgi:uncharacterized protein (TIGR02246 family)